MSLKEQYLNLSDLTVISAYVIEILQDYNYYNLSRNIGGDKLNETEKFVYLHLKAIYDAMSKEHIMNKEKRLNNE